MKDVAPSGCVLLLLSALCLLSIPPASRAEILWDMDYQPGTAPQRQPLPTDPTAEPAWQIASFAEPTIASLGANYLQIATGNANQPLSGAQAFLFELPAPSDAFTLAIEVAVPEQQADHYAGGLLLGSGSQFAELKFGREVALLSPADGGWTRGDFTGFSTFWLTLEPRGQAHRLTLYHESSSTPLQTLDAFPGPLQWIRFGDYSTSAVMNGTTQWRSIRWHQGQAHRPPWLPPVPQPGPTPTIDGGAVQILHAQHARHVSLERLIDAQERFSFILNSRGPVELAIRPDRFKIEEGQGYWVNTTQFEPARLLAEQDGVLILRFGAADHPVVNCHVQIEPIRDENLIPNGSFETVGPAPDHLPAGWQWRTSQALQPTLGYGHELIDPATPHLPASDMGGQAEVTVVSPGRTGQRSLRIHKPQIGEEVVVELTNPLALVADETYLVQGHYRLLEHRLGGAAHFLAELTGPGQTPRYVRDSLLNPLIQPTGETWRRSFFSFTVPAGYTHARLRLSLRGSPLTMLWDDLSINAAPTPLAQLPAQLDATEAADVMGSDEVRWHMANRPALEARLDNSSGTPILQINDRPVGSFGFLPGPNAYPIYGMHRQFGAAGIQIQWLPIYAGHTQNNQYGQSLWLADDTFDFSFLETQLSHLLQRNIDTRVMLYLNLDPPQGFVERHPEAAWINFNGDRTIGMKSHWRVADELQPHEILNFSYTAQAYRHHAGRLMEAMGAFLKDSPLGKAVIGVHLGGGSDGQFFSIHSPHHGDRSAGALAAYQQWLKDRYDHNVQALRAAWDEAEITFDTVTFPAEANRSPDHLYLQPQVGGDRKIIDWNRFISAGVVETLDHFGQAWKRGIDRPSLVTTYYNDAIHGQDLAKEALGHLLTSYGIDGAISVVPYGLTREPGRYGALNSLASSFNLHNKLFLAELDYRTNWAWLPADAWQFRADWGVPTTTAQWAHQLRRDLGQAMTLGGGAWLYGLGGNAWRTDDYLQVVREAAKAAQLQAEYPVGGDHGQVAVFVDEHVLSYSTRADLFGPATAVTNHASMRAVLSHSGLSWDRYLLSDLTHPDLPDYRLMIFLSSQTLTEDQIQAIEQRFQHDGRVLVFQHGVGTSHPDGFETVLPRVSGIQGRLALEDRSVRRLLPTATGQQTVPGLDELFTETRSSLFWVEDSAAEALATLSGTQGKVGLAIKPAADWTGVYIALPGGLSVALLRHLADRAGITPIGPAQDVTYAGRGMLVIHAIRDGEKTLQWSDPKDVLDLSSGKIVVRSATTIQLSMRAGETRWFRLHDHFQVVP